MNIPLDEFQKPHPSYSGGGGGKKKEKKRKNHITPKTTTKNKTPTQISSAKETVEGKRK